jgi:hypothetical protein
MCGFDRLGVHAESTEAFRPFLPQWTVHFAEILAAPLTSPDADYGLKIVVLQVTYTCTRACVRASERYSQSCI